MIQPIPTATYRIQLRGGVTFAGVESQLDTIKALGISHLYLSPIFAAGKDSTHGYDVLDPTVIEHSLGGREGFEKLANAAHDKGLGILLDIVPNHTAFILENAWLQDVLRHGANSRYASFFDIDWSAGPLVLPLLPQPFGAMLANGDFTIANGHWSFDGADIPLVETQAQSASTPDDLTALHEAQHWRLRHWELERDGITHRRFFNVTALIGMRVEDPAVFDATHSLIIELVEAGLVDGLRVDHIDGLADPKAYLDRVHEALPDTPVWVEKILVGSERLDPDWQTVGTTGYESARLIARLLTDGTGVEALDTTWREYTGVTEDFASALELAKLDILHNELSAELHQMSRLAGDALRNDPKVEPGPEGLREAVTQLLLGMSQYRTYIDASGSSEADKALLGKVIEAAKSNVRSSLIVERLADHLSAPQGEADHRLAVRLQQVSGALLAKSQEDTAGFRWTRYIAANEVGAEPEEPTVTDAEANAFLADRRSTEMNLTSTHDTKRSEDSRMRLVAISHHPEAFRALVDGVDHLAPKTLSPRWRWYIVQSVLALWGEPEANLADRLHQHNQKAMREAKIESFWTEPDEDAEAAADAFVDAICTQWQKARPQELSQIIETGEALSLAQLALKCLMPGFPDIYRGGEGPFFALTDPDNRLPVDYDAIARLESGQGFGADKHKLTRILLELRQTDPDFFNAASSEMGQGDTLTFRRSGAGRTLEMAFGRAKAGTPIWQSGTGEQVLTIAWV